MSLLSDEEFALVTSAQDPERMRARVMLLVAVKSLESEAEAIRDDADRLADSDVNPAIVQAFRYRADRVGREAGDFRSMLETS